MSEQAVAGEFGSIEELLRQPHHPFLDVMRPFFDERQFYHLLTMTKERLGTLDFPDIPDTIIPRSADRIFVIPDSHNSFLKVQTNADIMRKYDQYSEEEILGMERAALFAIWAHGTNPDEKARTRRTGEPYVMHVLRVQRRLLGYQHSRGYTPDICEAAALHDVVEDTPYTLDDINTLFGSQVMTLVDETTKIRSRNLADTSKLSTRLIIEYLKHMGHDYQPADIPPYNSIQNIPDVPIDATKFNQSIKDASKRHLASYSKTKRGVQLLTFFRLLYLLRKPDAMGALFIKLADVADNTATLDGYGPHERKKAREKAMQAQNIFLPVARILGDIRLMREIEQNIFPVLQPKRAEKLHRRVSQSPEIPEEHIQQLNEVRRHLMESFSQWAQTYHGNLLRGDFMELVDSYLQRMTLPEIDSLPSTEKSKNRPMMVFDCTDSLLANLFYQFLTTTNDPPEVIVNTYADLHEINNGQVGVMDVLIGGHVGKYRFKIIRPDPTIANLYKVGSTSSMVATATRHLTDVQQLIDEEGLGNFFERLPIERVAVTVVQPDKKTSQKEFLLSGLGDYDLDVLKGKSLNVRIVRHGKKGTFPIEEGDILYIEIERPIDESDYIVKLPFIRSPEALKIVRKHIRKQIESGFNKAEVLQKLEQRGRDIVKIYIDVLLEYTVHGDRIEDDMPFVHETLFNWLIEDPIFQNIQLTPEDYVALALKPWVYPRRRQDWNFKWIKRLNKVSFMKQWHERVFSWMQDHCVRIMPDSVLDNGRSTKAGVNDLTYLAAPIRVRMLKLNEVESSIDITSTLYKHEPPPGCEVLYDETFNPIMLLTYEGRYDKLRSYTGDVNALLNDEAIHTLEELHKIYGFEWDLMKFLRSIYGPSTAMMNVKRL